MDADEARHHVPPVQQDRAGELPGPYRDTAQLGEPSGHIRQQEGREVDAAPQSRTRI